MKTSDFNFEPGLRFAMEAEGVVHSFAQGSVLFRPGELCQKFLLVRSGTVKVSQTTSAGREILLYRVGPGESCILSTACLLADERFAAEGITESEVTALMLSAASFERLMISRPSFRRLVFAGYAARIAALMARIATLVDKPLDVRLATCLLERAGTQAAIDVTHNDLAIDIGTAREVVSRGLASFAGAGLIERTRRSIVILDRARLTAIAGR